MGTVSTGPGGEAWLEEIPEAECWSLLEEQEVGRFAVGVAGAAPHVVPVNYRLRHGDVYFRTGHGTKLLLLGTGPVSFEVDEVDRGARWGWSVVVQGRAYEATRWETHQLALEPWVGAGRDHWVRIVPERVSGRRIHLAAAAGEPAGA